MNDESILLTIQGHGKEPVYMIPLIFATTSPVWINSRACMVKEHQG